MPARNARYAVYLAPAAGTPLWRFGSAVLGYDAGTGEDVQGWWPPSVGAAAWRAATEGARGYGFHCTLKAPFRLAPGRHEVELVEALEDHAFATPPLPPIRLAPAVLDDGPAGGFVALVPEAPVPALSALERATVLRLDAFRAPLTDAEIARRDPARLSPRQRRQLAAFGYPFIFDDYRPHFTLSDRIADPARIGADIAAALAAQVGDPVLVADHLALFRQEAPQARFRILARAPLAGGVAAVPGVGARHG